MDLNRLTRDADDLIRKVVSRYNQLYVPAGSISQLELDLMLDDLRKLYDTFKNIGLINLTLKDTIDKPEVKVNAAVPSDPQAAASAAPTYYNKEYFNSHEPAQAPPQPKQEAEPVTEKGLDYDQEQEFKAEPEPEIILPVETDAEIITENVSSSEPTFENPVQTISELPEDESSDNVISENIPQVIPDHSPAMLADKFSTGNKSLSETMASTQPQGSMGSRIQFQPITNLITGIGLNDKFSFISDLFGNSTAQYEEAIHRINKAVNLDEANWILQKYHSVEWDTKQETLARLKDFVKRRFI
jgi:hypothetical protein